MARFQHSQLFSIRRGQAKCRIVGNYGELWKVKKVILGKIVRDSWGIVRECGRKCRKKKNFVV